VRNGKAGGILNPGRPAALISDTHAVSLVTETSLGLRCLVRKAKEVAIEDASSTWVPTAWSCCFQIPRRPGSESLLVPGRLSGRNLFRLNETWEWIIRCPDQPCSSQSVATRGSDSHVRVGIAPEHSEQLLGHRGRPITDTVYLHRHGPSLVHAAAIYELFIRRLLGDLPSEAKEPASPTGQVLSFQHRGLA